MKRIILILISILLNNCYNYSHYMQNYQLNSFIPVDRTVIGKNREKNDFVSSIEINYNPKTSFKSNNDKHSPVNDSGKTEIVEYITDPYKTSYYLKGEEGSFTGYNTNISQPDFSLNMNLEYDVMKYMFILLSTEFSRKNSSNIFKLSAGAGGGYELNKFSIQFALRGGFVINNYDMDILHGDSEGYSLTNKNEIHFSPYLQGNLSINTINEFLSMNYFADIGINYFQYINATIMLPGEVSVLTNNDAKYNNNITSIVLSPGIFKDLGPSRVIFGSRFLIPTKLLGGVDKNSEKIIPSVFLQFQIKALLKKL